MARQCPRGRPGAAEGGLHRDAPGAPHLALPPASARASFACSASSSGETPHQSARRRQIPRGETTPISSGRKRPAILFGGAGRGRRGECFDHGGDGGGHRCWPEGLGGGVGDPESPVRSRGRERSARGGWAGSGDRPRPEPGRLSSARVGRFGPVGSKRLWPFI
jgi:hypothetical protein